MLLQDLKYIAMIFHSINIGPSIFHHMFNAAHIFQLRYFAKILQLNFISLATCYIITGLDLILKINLLSLSLMH